VEDYEGIIVQDHEATFYKFGADHQGCLAHILRGLKDSIENEPDRTWNKEIHTLIQEMFTVIYNNCLMMMLANNCVGQYVLATL